MQVHEVLFALLRSEVCGQTAGDEVKNALSDAMLSQLYMLSNQHDLAHIVSRALEKLGITGEEGVLQDFKRKNLQAIYRYVRLDYDFSRVCAAFEEAKIAYLPLKGALLRAYYPEAWMRTSCDVDVLVKKENLDAAKSILVNQLGFYGELRSAHDVSFYSGNEVHFELHHTLIEHWRSEEQNDLLQNIWSVATPAKEGTYRYAMPDEWFYFYYTAHMAKHVTRGGCGIRAFLDLWIMENCMAYDSAKREALLKQGGLEAFSRTARQLSQVWFSGQPADPLAERLGKFVLAGGIYGTYENNIAARQSKVKGKMRYIRSRLFERYEMMVVYYPVLEKHRWLLPFFQVVRWAHRIFSGGAGRAVRELRINARTTHDERKFAGELLEELQLQ